MVNVSILALPRSTRSEIAGRSGQAWRVRLKAPPAQGAANEELVDLLAKVLSIPKAAVVVRAGWSSRRKLVRISADLGRDEIEALLDRAAGGPSGRAPERLDGA